MECTVANEWECEACHLWMPLKKEVVKFYHNQASSPPLGPHTHARVGRGRSSAGLQRHHNWLNNSRVRLMKQFKLFEHMENEVRSLLRWRYTARLSRNTKSQRRTERKAGEQATQTVRWVEEYEGIKWWQRYVYKVSPVWGVDWGEHWQFFAETALGLSYEAGFGVNEVTSG